MKVWKSYTVPLFSGKVADSGVALKQYATYNANFPGSLKHNRNAVADSINESTLSIAGPELSNYEKVKVVGQGSFGVAILYRRKFDGHPVVFKQINLVDLTPTERDLAMNEVDVFSKLHHPNIISYLGSFIKDNMLLIEMEYADGGTLANIINERLPRDFFPERYVIAVFEQITSAINYMHTENIMHRDLKTANVFLNKRGIVKIGDFGISKIMNTKIHAQTVLGTPYYFSPEMCEGKEYDYKSDIWALGCILGEMCCLRKTFAATNLSELVTKIMAGSYTPLPPGYSSALRSLLKNILQVDAMKRPNALEILEYWMPLIFRNLGKQKGYCYEDDIGLYDITTTSQDISLASTARTDTKELMKASTASPTECIEKRSVLYQLKAFGQSFSLNPIQLPPKLPISSVATSDSHFVVVSEDGSVYTWGEGARGQLGFSSLDTWKHYPTRLECVRKYHIAGACAGNDFTILWTTAGLVLGCGDNSNYSLGHKDNRTYDSPKVIEKLENIKICQVSAGAQHVLALSKTGLVFSWGSSIHGALGLGNEHIQQITPQMIILSNVSSKPVKIVCGPNTSAILFQNGEAYVCGSNDYNKLGFTNPGRIMTFKKISIRRKVLDLDFSPTHSVLLIEGGYVLTMGRNSEGQRGLGHCNPVDVPTIVTAIKDKYISMVKCSDQCTIVATDDNVITFWGTRNGIPEVSQACHNLANASESENYPKEIELGNCTAAFTNFLASVYKSELVLEPIDILALYSSKEQFEKGYYVELNNIYPLPHSILVLVNTTTPLILSYEDKEK